MYCSRIGSMGDKCVGGSEGGGGGAAEVLS